MNPAHSFSQYPAGALDKVRGAESACILKIYNLECIYNFMKAKKIFSLTLLLFLVLVTAAVSKNRGLIFSSLSLAQKSTATVLPAKTTTPQPPTIDTAKLEKYLTVEAALLGISDSISIYFKDLPAGADVGINPVQSWIPASTIKAFVAIEAFRQRDQGIIDFGEPVTIQAQNVVPTELETDQFPRLREGTTTTIQQLVEVMIIQSDNTAYNTLLDILNRRNINATLRNLGITQTTVGEKLNLDDNQFSVDLQVPGRQPNTITAKDFATLFDLLYNNRISHSEEIISIFKRQQINNMIPALLPTNTVVAHKTGDWSPIYHDGGIVYKPDDPFIISIFTNANDPIALAQLARVAYFRTNNVVGGAPTTNINPKNAQAPTDERIYLAQIPESANVLAAETALNNNGERAYTVRSGDTLWDIAQSVYGSGFYNNHIIARNDLGTSGLAEGQTLILPPIPGTAFPPQAEPTVAAGDLGVTLNDLKVGKAQLQTIRAAFILPGAPLYLAKKWLEKASVNLAATTDAKIDALIRSSENRLAEVKSELSLGNVQAAKGLLTDSEKSLAQATTLAKLASNNGVVLFKVRQMRDINFGVLQEISPQIPEKQKEAYIDAVFAFYQKQKQEVAPAIASTLVANPLQQAPIIGTVTSVQNNVATVRQDSGKTAMVALTSLTPSRTSGQTSESLGQAPAVGERIAAVGQVTPAGITTAQFVLRKLPQNLPIGHRGTVVEIDPGKHEIKIQDARGRIDTVIIDAKTVIRSKDTNVDIAGIKAGSTITVVGNTVPVSPSPTPTSTSKPLNPTTTGGAGSTGNTGISLTVTPTNAPKTVTPTTTGSIKVSATVSPTGPLVTGTPTVKLPTTTGLPAKLETKPVNQTTGKNSVTKTASGAPKTAPTGPTINASSVTVEKNSSGKNEKVSGSPPPAAPPRQQKSENKSAPPPAAPPPKPPEAKPTEEKKK